MVYLKISFVEVYAEALRGGIRGRSYTKVLRGGLTRTCFSIGNACNGLVLRGSLTRRPYAEPLGIFLEFAIRGRCYASLTRRPYTEVLRGAIFQWGMLATAWSYAEALRGGLTRSPCFFENLPYA